MLDPERFQRCLRALGGGAPSGETFAGLSASYHEPGRAYHNARHIEDCLGELDRTAGEAVHVEEVEAALWFHDAVYIAGAPDNERRSAELASSVLARFGVRPDVRRRVHEFILATAHESVPTGRDAALTVDIDLSILGQSTERFDAYDRQIRQEYSHIPEGPYRTGRRRVLETIAARPRIFLTAPFFERYEITARANLARALAGLKAGQ